MRRIQTFAIALLFAAAPALTSSLTAAAQNGINSPQVRHPVINFFDITRDSWLLFATALVIQLIPLSFFLLCLPDRRKLGVWLGVVSFATAGFLTLFPSCLNYLMALNRM